ncbi:MAG: divalent-cation tolerance protein CutA [Parerythrobacter sp.]
MTALVYTTVGTQEEARALARTLFAERLIVCANIGQLHTALYVEDGNVNELQEASLLCKTHRALLDRTVARIEALHPYDSPVVTGWNADAAGAFAGEWTALLVGAGNTIS